MPFRHHFIASHTRFLSTSTQLGNFLVDFDQILIWWGAGLARLLPNIPFLKIRIQSFHWKIIRSPIPACHGLDRHEQTWINFLFRLQFSYHYSFCCCSAAVCSMWCGSQNGTTIQLYQWVPASQHVYFRSGKTKITIPRIRFGLISTEFSLCGKFDGIEILHKAAVGSIAASAYIQLHKCRSIYGRLGW